MGPRVVLQLLVVVAVRLRLGILLLWTLRRFCPALLTLIFIYICRFAADVLKSFDTVDRGTLDRVLISLGLPAWFRHAYFEYHSHVRLRFKLAPGLGQPWTSGWWHSSRLPFEHDVHCCFVLALMLVSCCSGKGLSLSCMRITLSVFLDTLVSFCGLQGSLRGMSGWWGRNLLLVSVSL